MAKPEIDLTLQPGPFRAILSGADRAAPEAAAETRPGQSLLIREAEGDRLTGRWLLASVSRDPSDFSRMVLAWPPAAFADVPDRADQAADL